MPPVCTNIRFPYLQDNGEYVDHNDVVQNLWRQCEEKDEKIAALQERINDLLRERLTKE